MNWLDRTIEWVSPARGLARARARAATRLVRGYDGAKHGRQTDGWWTQGTSANAEIGPKLAILRDRMRDLDRNNPLVRRAVAILAGNIVGTGILPTAQGRSATRAMKAFAEWSTRACDVDGRCDVYGIQLLAVRTMIVSGESLVRRLPRRPGEMAGAVPLQLQVLEPDYFDMAKTEELSDGGRIIQGVEFDARGRRVAYWLFDHHPGDAAVSLAKLSFISRRVPAEDIVHLYRVERPGQIHGVPWLAAVITETREIADYSEAEIVRKKIEACVVGFVTSDESGTGAALAPVKTDADGNQVETFEPGLIQRLKPGEGIEFNNPAPSSGATDFLKMRHRMVAVGAGVTYEQLTADLSGVNYSSYRAGHLDFRREIETARWQIVIPILCETIWSWFVDAAWMAGAVPTDEIAAKWSPQRFESVEPQKDAEADLLEIRMGTKTWEQAVAERGYDPDEQLAAMAAWLKKLDDAGIVLDVDPRRQARNGNPAAKAAGQQAEAQPAT